MPQIVAAVPFVATAAAVTAPVISAAVVFQTVLVVASTALSYYSAKKAMNIGEHVQGRQEMIRQPISARRKIYGSIRVSGPLAYYGTTGIKNKFLYMSVLLASTACNAITTVYFDDQLSGSPRYSSVHTKELTNLGADDQLSSTLLQEVPEWTSDHRLRGITHLPLKLQFDQEAYKGVPQVRAIVEGALVYDPRKDSTNGGTGAHRLADPSTWEYSTNPVLCIADYIKDDVVGMNLNTTDTIHWPTVIASADICDEVVTRAGGGGTEARYTLNGEVLSTQNPADVLPDMLSACSGTIVPNLDGKLYIYAGAWAVPTITLTADDLAGELQIVERASRAQLINRLTGTYYDKMTFYPAEFPQVTNATFVTEDDGQDLPTSVEFPYTDGSSEAQRLANNELLRNRDQGVVVFPANLEAIQLAAHSTVFLTLPFFDYDEETFRIVDYKIDLPNGVVNLFLKKESADTWAWEHLDFSLATTPPAATTPDPFDVEAPTLNALVNTTEIAEDGTVFSSVEVPFTQAPDKAVVRYEAEYKQSASANWIPAAPVTAPSDADDVSTLSTKIDKLTPAIDYDFRIRSVSYEENFSDYVTTVDHTTSGDVTPPSVPTGLIITPGTSSLNLNWINPSEEDFNAIKLYRRINSTSPSESDLLTTLSGDRAKISRYIDVVGATTTYFYWIRSVDRTGNESALTSFVSGAATSIASEGADWDVNVGNRPIELIDGRITDAIKSGGIFQPGRTIDQGDSVARIAPKGTGYSSARDGVAVSYTQNWHSSTIPEIRFTTGGITSSATLTNPVIQDYKALSPTVSGFTPSLRLKELTGATTPRTDTGAVEDTTDIQWSMDKSVSDEAFNDDYLFQFDVTIRNIFEEPGLYTPGQIVVGIYIDDGGGFTQYGTLVVNGGSTTSTTARLNLTKLVTVDGVGTIAGKEFRVVNETGVDVGQGLLEAFDSVKYTTAAAATDEDATPTGAEDVQFQIVGGSEVV